MSTGTASNIIIRLQNLPNEARAIDIVSADEDDILHHTHTHSLLF